MQPDSDIATSVFDRAEIEDPAGDVFYRNGGMGGAGAADDAAVVDAATGSEINRLVEDGPNHAVVSNIAGHIFQRNPDAVGRDQPAVGDIAACSEVHAGAAGSRRRAEDPAEIHHPSGRV